MFPIEEVLSELTKMQEKFQENWNTLGLDGFVDKIKVLESKMASPNFWDNPTEANRISKEVSDLKKQYQEWADLKTRMSNYQEILEMLKQEPDTSLLNEAEKEWESLKQEFRQKELYVYFNGQFDKSNAFLSINAGAGGTESCDWASMLSRMYIRWAENNDYEVEIVDELPGEEAGIKNITFYIKGLYVYGKLKAESGVHRLVRISPFDANAKRHTSFASVSVIPEIEEDIEVEINPADLKIDTYRSGGAGGQHVNKTESAVRITHLPTGIIVTCQQDRSQHKNREKAMQLLKAKLYQYYEKQKNEEHKKLEGDKKDISWGNQIRSYVFQPYQLVKDHRTNYEVGNVSKVMDGYIDDFIFEYLKWNLKK